MTEAAVVQCRYACAAPYVTCYCPRYCTASHCSPCPSTRPPRGTGGVIRVTADTVIVVVWSTRQWNVMSEIDRDGDRDRVMGREDIYRRVGRNEGWRGMEMGFRLQEER